MEKIIQAISTLDKTDDGIKLNQKYTHISSILQKECTTAKQLRETYHRLNEQSLKDSAFAMKFAMLGSSRLFLALEIFGQNIQSLMTAVMKENFDNLDTLCNTNIDGFFNSITLFAEFYKRAKTIDGAPIPGLVRPLMVYFKKMLELNTQRSAKEFTNQMNQNGKILHIIHPDEISDLMILVRKHLLSKDIENESARMWLLLCLDLSHNNFCSIGDGKLGQFYMQLVESLSEKKICTNSNSKNAFCSKEDSNQVIVDSTDLRKDKQNHEVDKERDISEQKKDSINKIDNHKNRTESSDLESNEINSKVNSHPIDKPVQNIQTPRLPRSTSSCQVLSRNMNGNKDTEIINAKSVSSKQNDAKEVNPNQNLRRGGQPIVWGNDPTMKKFSMSRSKSHGQLTPSRMINKNINNENNSLREGYNSKHNERKESSFSTPPRTINKNRNEENNSLRDLKNNERKESFSIPPCDKNRNNENNSFREGYDPKPNERKKSFSSPPHTINKNRNDENKSLREGYDLKNNERKESFSTPPCNKNRNNEINSLREGYDHKPNEKKESFPIPPRAINKNRNENNSLREGYDSKHNERKESSSSPPRVNARLSYNSVMRTVEADSQLDQKKNCGTKLLSPRERAEAKLSPHQALLEKTQRLAIQKTRLASQQKANEINKSPIYMTNESQDEGRRNNMQKKKMTKAYLQDKNIENLTWNNSNTHTEIESKNTNISPHFLKYLERD